MHRALRAVLTPLGIFPQVGQLRLIAIVEEDRGVGASTGSFLFPLSGLFRLPAIIGYRFLLHFVNPDWLSQVNDLVGLETVPEPLAVVAPCQGLFIVVEGFLVIAHANNSTTAVKPPWPGG